MQAQYTRNDLTKGAHGLQYTRRVEIIRHTREGLKTRHRGKTGRKHTGQPYKIKQEVLEVTTWENKVYDVNLKINSRDTRETL